MSQECRKAMLRRLYDPAFHQRYFVGKGIDIGAGDDSAAKYAFLFPRIQSMASWDWQQGDAAAMADLPANSYDFVVSHHCLEHIDQPWKALQRWIDITKPGGHLILVVPDEQLYEHGKWPSPFNADHKARFSVELLCRCLTTQIAGAEIIKIERLGATFDFAEAPEVDQTQGVGECAIEFVLHKP